MEFYMLFKNKLMQGLWERPSLGKMVKSCSMDLELLLMQQAADLIARIAFVMKQCDEDDLISRSPGEYFRCLTIYCQRYWYE